MSARTAAAGAPAAQAVDLPDAAAGARANDQTEEKKRGPRPSTATPFAHELLLAAVQHAPQPAPPAPQPGGHAHAGVEALLLGQGAGSAQAQQQAHGPLALAAAPGAVRPARPAPRALAPEAVAKHDKEKPAAAGTAPQKPQRAVQAGLATQVTAPQKPKAQKPAEHAPQAPQVQARKSEPELPRPAPQPAQVKGAEPLLDRTAAAPPAPAHAQPASALLARPVQAPELQHDPSLRLDVQHGHANVSLDAQGALSLRIDVRGGVANVRAAGDSAALLARHLPELRQSLTASGLSLGNFSTADQGPRGGEPERPDADAPRPPARVGPKLEVAKSNPSTRSRVDIEA